MSSTYARASSAYARCCVCVYDKLLHACMFPVLSSPFYPLQKLTFLSFPSSLSLLFFLLNRRFTWSVFRVEREQVANIGENRAVSFTSLGEEELIGPQTIPPVSSINGVWVGKGPFDVIVDVCLLFSPPSLPFSPPTFPMSCVPRVSFVNGVWPFRYYCRRMSSPLPLFPSLLLLSLGSPPAVMFGLFDLIVDACFTLSFVSPSLLPHFYISRYTPILTQTIPPVYSINGLMYLFTHVSPPPSLSSSSISRSPPISLLSLISFFDKRAVGRMPPYFLPLTLSFSPPSFPPSLLPCFALSLSPLLTYFQFLQRNTSAISP